MGLFDAIDIAGSGLTAERVRMDVTAENLANAQTTRTANGQPYRRQEVVLAQHGQPSGFQAQLAGAEAANPTKAAGQPPAGGVEVSEIVADRTPDQQVYDPGNPEANAQGYVQMPNISTVTEMTDLISESRSYQSDVTAMQTAKSMFTATLGLLK
ncbi:MAG TPA: flagellar basal body rod protein FlgC [Solirubrobacteraceae bacterium]|nr:flagellar basal body rod protein FlgC [Solirubrobacteraceae bacterium]